MCNVGVKTSWLADFLQPRFSEIERYINADPDFQAAAPANAATTVQIGLASSSHNGSDQYDDQPNMILIKVSKGQVSFSNAPHDESSTSFCLQARPEDWRSFFASDSDLKRPYQSFWGMLRVLSPEHPEICVYDHDGMAGFGRYARLWRIILDRSRDAIHSEAVRPLELELPEDENNSEDDAVTGKYLWLPTKAYGKVKIFYETAGDGAQSILFLHTAGSDSRQYHSLMNNKQLQTICTMYAFDLPAHGRSSLGTVQMPEKYALTEEAYLESIRLVIQRLDLKDVIVCGASMAGHICLAVAIHARELGVRGVIPCEGCEHLPLSQPIYEITGSDASLLDPERVCGMIAPTSPEYHKRQIWWQYSSQGYNVFAGDLKFYFKGWDGRGRIETIDTRYCPVYMLTGEYDYSCTVEASRATAGKIPGAKFEEMKGLGHFPLTENPKAVLPYLLRAITYIQEHRQ